MAMSSSWHATNQDEEKRQKLQGVISYVQRYRNPQKGVWSCFSGDLIENSTPAIVPNQIT
jgi:hypothetical protein